MKDWEPPSTGTWHFLSAPDAPPHRFEDCHPVECFGLNRRGWLGWCAKGALVDPDDDPNRLGPNGLPLP